MDKWLELIKGKKTFIIAIVTAVLGTLQALGIFAVPEYAWPIIAAAGLATLRLGVNKVAEGVKPK